MNKRYSAKAAIGLPSQCFVVLYAGAHGEANDLGVALEAASHLRDNSEISFVFLGDGKEKLALTEKAKEMGLNNIEFLPPVSKGEMPGVLASADVCLAILKPIEAFKTTYPNKVFDYMAAGKPVVATRVGGVSDLVLHQKTGILVPPKDSHALARGISQMLSLPVQDRLAMGKAGRARVYPKYRIDTLIQNVEALYEELLMKSSVHS